MTVLLCIAVVAVVVLAVLVARVRTVPQAVGGGLVLGGAAGNLSERIVSDGPRGQVPDFITLTHWPTFNVADAAVTFGVIVLVVALIVSLAATSGEASGGHAGPDVGRGGNGERR